VPLHCIPKSVLGECGGCWGCSPNPTDLAVISSLQAECAPESSFFPKTMAQSSQTEMIHAEMGNETEGFSLLLC